MLANNGLVTGITLLSFCPGSLGQGTLVLCCLDGERVVVVPLSLSGCKGINCLRGHQIS